MLYELCTERTRSYRLRTGLRLTVRHQSRDVTVLIEIFGPPHVYEPPAALLATLARPLRVLDLGGNIGLFGLFAFSRFRIESLTSFEPDPQNFRLLQRNVAQNSLAPIWAAENVAVSNAEESISFLSGALSESRRAQHGELATEVRAVDLFASAPVADLLKLDIEGSEWVLLADPRMKTLSVQVIVVEWHWRFAPHHDPHQAAIALLTDAGYRVLADVADPRHGVGLLWCRRTSAD